MCQRSGCTRDRIFALTIAFLSFFVALPCFAEKLSIEITAIDNALQVSATLGPDTQIHTIDAQDMIVPKLKTIYDLLEPKKDKTGTLENANRFMKDQFEALRGLWKKVGDDSKKEPPADPSPDTDELKLLLETVGRSLFNPIDALIESATAIEFVIAEKDLFFPLDALYYKGIPLFLHKPILYTFSQSEGARWVISKEWNGCLISDPATAPGKAVLHIKAYFPNSQFFDGQKIGYEDIQNMKRAEFVLLSAKGGPQGIELPKTVIRPWYLSHLQPKLVFLNANKLGLSIDFMKAFQQAGAFYYIAPIFDFESEDASVKMMDRFFRALRNGNPPSYSMYLTRKTLYDECQLEGKDFHLVMCDVFPFRVYRLN